MKMEKTKLSKALLKDPVIKGLIKLHKQGWKALGIKEKKKGK